MRFYLNYTQISDINWWLVKDLKVLFYLFKFYIIKLYSIIYVILFSILLQCRNQLKLVTIPISY